MGPKAKPEVPTPPVPGGVKEGRPRSQADTDLEHAQEELRSSEGKLAELTRRYEENTQRLLQVRRLEEQAAPLEDNKRKIIARFKRVLHEGGTPAPADSCGNAVSQRALKDLLAETAEVLLRILSDTFRAAGGKSADEEEFKCPLGLSQDTFAKVLDLRASRLLNDEELDVLKQQLSGIRDEVNKAKAEGIGKPLIRRTEKLVHSRKEEERVLAHKVQQEDDEWNKAKEEEEWQKQLRAQVEGDSAKKPAK